MQHDDLITLLSRRRDGIRDWLDDAAPYTAVDQKHLDANTPERAYWHHGYEQALHDVLRLLDSLNRKSGSADNQSASQPGGPDESDFRAG